MLIVGLMVLSTAGVASVATAAPKTETHQKSIPTYMILSASNRYPEPYAVIKLTVTLKAFEGANHNYPLANKYVWIYRSSSSTSDTFLVKTNAHGEAVIFYKVGPSSSGKQPTMKFYALFSRDGRYTPSMSNIVGIHVVTKQATHFSTLSAQTFTLSGYLYGNGGGLSGKLVQLLKGRCPACDPQATGIYARTDSDGKFKFKLDPKGLPGYTPFAVEFKGDTQYKGSISNPIYIDIPGPNRA